MGIIFSQKWHCLNSKSDKSTTNYCVCHSHTRKCVSIFLMLITAGLIVRMNPSPRAPASCLQTSCLCAERGSLKSRCSSCRGKFASKTFASPSETSSHCQAARHVVKAVAANYFMVQVFRRPTKGTKFLHEKIATNIND